MTDGMPRPTAEAEDALRRALSRAADDVLGLKIAAGALHELANGRAVIVVGAKGTAVLPLRDDPWPTLVEVAGRSELRTEVGANPAPPDDDGLDPYGAYL